MKIVRFLIILIELIICYILQSSVFINLSFVAVIPDLVMVIVVTMAYMRGSNAGILYGFCAGLLLDVVNGNHFGLYALLYLCIGFLCGFANRFYRKDNNVLPLALVVVAEFICLSVYYLFEHFMRGSMTYSFYLNYQMLPKITYTVFLAVFLYKLCQISISWSLRSTET